MRHARPIFADDHHELYDQFQFSPAVRVGPFIYISGVVGADENGKSFADPIDEYNVTFSTIEQLLAVEGATMADIVALDSFHVTTDLITELQVFNQVRAKYMQAPHPAWTAIQVVALGIRGARAEVKVTAYLGKEDA